MMSIFPTRLEISRKFPCCTLRGREGRFLGNDISFLFPLETSHVRTLSPIPLVVDASGACTRKEAPGSPGMSAGGHGDVTHLQPSLNLDSHPATPSSFLFFLPLHSSLFHFHPSRVFHTRYLTACPAQRRLLGGDAMGDGSEGGAGLWGEKAEEEDPLPDLGAFDVDAIEVNARAAPIVFSTRH